MLFLVIVLLHVDALGMVGCICMLNSKMQRQVEGGLPPCGRSKNSVRSEFLLRAVANTLLLLMLS